MTPISPGARGGTSIAPAPFRNLLKQGKRDVDKRLMKTGAYTTEELREYRQVFVMFDQGNTMDSTQESI
jgi:hypothetical protein